jgi:hypothetical protein
MKKVVLIALALIVCPILMPDGTFLQRLGGALVSRVAANTVGAQRETSVGAKVLKAVTGISILDIERYDWKGGPRSIVNDPCGAVCRDIGVDWKPPWAAAETRTFSRTS